jgi:hypothetical protein
MSTPPITETIELVRPRPRRRLSRRALRRTGWLAIDLAAIAGCAVYALQAVT